MVQISKNVFSGEGFKIYFESGQYLFDGYYALLKNYLLISGHTAIAFSLAFCLSMFSQSKKWQLLYVLMAILVAYSRIYLAHHSAWAILQGVFAGIGSSLCIYLIDHIVKEKRSKSSNSITTPSTHRQLIYN